MTYTVRAGTLEDFDGIEALLQLAFHVNNDDDAQMVESDRLVFEPTRSLVAVDGPEIVGHTGIFTRDLTVPGGVIPAAFVTMVSVAATHRRQGIARTILTRQLREARAAGEPVALLWASEGRIYQRYGYGMASRRLGISADTREIAFLAPRPEGGRIREDVPAKLRKQAAQVYDAVVAERPGYFSRPGNWWEFLFSDPAARRHGYGVKRLAVHEGPSGVDGYALFRVRPGWDAGGPRGEVEVLHTVAANPGAYSALWRYLLGMDLTRTVHLSYGAADEALLDMVHEPRRLRPHFSDGLWLRVLDVTTALAGRQYAASPDLVIEVTDPLIEENNGCFEISGARSPREPDLTLDIATLAALYLGGGSAGALAEAGRITERRPGAIAGLDAAFRWHRAPVGIEGF